MAAQEPLKLIARHWMDEWSVRRAQLAVKKEESGEWKEGNSVAELELNICDWRSPDAFKIVRFVYSWQRKLQNSPLFDL